MPTTRNRLSVLVGIVAALNTALAPAYAAPGDAPYFRLRYGVGQTTPELGSNNNGFQVYGGPSGAYYTRVNNPFPGIPTPSASAGPVTWTASGALPQDMTLDSKSGALTGTPTVAGNYGPMSLSGSYTSPEGVSESASTQPFSLGVLGTPSIAYHPPAQVPMGARYDLYPTVDGVGSGKYALNQPVPSGLAFDQGTGVVSVLANASGSFSNLVVTVTDFDKQTATSAPFGLTVGSRTASVSAPDGQSAIKGVPFSLAFTTLGLTAPVTFATAAGTLPPGLFYCSGPDRICGTPSQAGSYSGLVVSALGADGLGAVMQNPITISVNAPSLSYASSSYKVGTPFSLAPQASYLPDASYAFQSTPPAGLVIDPKTGVISGALTSTDPVTSSVAATTAYGTTPSNAFTLTGKLDAFAVTASPAFVQAHVGYPVGQQFTAGTSANVTWSVTSGALPVGLALEPSLGLVYGSGTAPASASGVVITAKGGGQTSSSGPQQYRILALPTVGASPAYTATAGQAFTQAFSASNLIGTPSYSTDTSKLPPGLSLNSDGTLTGTPLQAGTYDGIVVSVTDLYDGSTGKSPAFTLAVVPSDGSMMAAGMPDRFSVRLGNPLATQAPTVSGTNQSVVWSLAPDSAPLPAGMTLNPNTGVISGTPTQTGDTAGIVLVATEVVQKAGLLMPGQRVRLASNDPAFVVAAAGSPAPRSARTRNFTITVAPPLTVSNVQQTYAIKVAAPVSVAPQANGVLGTTSWTLSGGTLPNAVGFDPSTGRIAGPALTAGRIPDGVSSKLVVTAVDSFDGATAKSSPFVFTIDPGLVVVGPNTIGTRTGVAYTSGQQFNATNAQGALTWQVLGTLPSGFTVDPATGIISGQSDQASVTNGLRMQAVQSDNTAGVSAPFNFVVQGGLQVSYPPSLNSHVNKPMPSVTPTVTGAQGAVSYGVATGVLPPGIRVDSGSGMLLGTPTTSGVYPGIQIGAADSSGNNGVSQPITVIVDGGLAFRTLIKGLTGRVGTPFTSTAPAVSGAIGNLHYRFAGSLFDWKVDPDTGVISGSPMGNYYGAYIGQDWLIAYDDAGGAVSHPSVISTSFGPLELGCTYGTGICFFNVTGGVPTTIGVGYPNNLIGQPTYTKVDTWPDWLSLDPLTGIAYGTPPAGTGEYTFTTQLRDGFDGSTASRARRITVDGNPNRPNLSTVLSVCALSGGTVDTGVAHVAGTDPNAPITLSPDQPLAPWLTFEPATGRISGTVPSGPSAYYYLRFAEYTLDPNGNRVDMDGGYHYITTYPTPADFNFPAQAAIGYQAGTNYDPSDPNQRFQFAIGDSPLFYVSGGSIPPGMTFDSSYWRDVYWLAGTPTVPGTYTFSVTGQASQCNGNAVSVTKQVTVTVKGNPNTYVDSPASLYARVGVPFRGPKPTIVNPMAPDMTWGWGVDYGLPAGLGLDQGDGSIYGTPTETSNASKRYTAGNCCKYGYVDARSNGWWQFIVLAGPAITVSDVSIPAGAPASISPNATGFLGQVAWSGTNMPPGLGVDPATGQIVGTPATTGTFSGVTVTGTETTRASLGPNDPNARYPSATSNPFSVTVTAGVAIGNVADQARILGQPFDVKPTATGFTGSLTWYATGNLPDGVSIDPATGAISGPGNRYGNYPIKVGVSSSSGLSSTSGTFTLSVTDRNNLVPTGSSTWTWGEQVCTYSCTPPTTSTVTTPTTTTSPGTVVTTPGTTTTSNVQCTILGGLQYCGTVDPATGKIHYTTGTIGASSGTTTTTTPGTTTVVPGTTTTTYSTSTVTTPGTCSGRQLQYCSGDGCEAHARGCDAPYVGGDTSFPVGTVATSCQNPSIQPSENYCPKPASTDPTSGSGSTSPKLNGWWAYNPIGGASYNGNKVNYYRLSCFDQLGGIGGPNCSATPPTTITDCMVNAAGIGNCGTGVDFAGGGMQLYYNSNINVVISNKYPF